MPTTLFIWEPVVECFVAQDYLESQPPDSADYQFIIYILSVDIQALYYVNIDSKLIVLY